MSAPSWLLDAIHAEEPGRVPTVPNAEIHTWVQSDNTQVIVYTAISRSVPIVPSIPREMQSLSDKSEIVDAQRGRRRAKVQGLLERKRINLLCL